MGNKMALATLVTINIWEGVKFTHMVTGDNISTLAIRFLDNLIEESTSMNVTMR